MMDTQSSAFGSFTSSTTGSSADMLDYNPSSQYIYNTSNNVNSDSPYISNNNYGSNASSSPETPTYPQSLSPNPMRQNAPLSPIISLDDVGAKIANSTELLKTQSVTDLKNLILPLTNKKSPFYLNIPTSSKPVSRLIKRLHAWIKVLKSLINYYQMLAISSQQMSKIHLNMCEAVNFPMFTNGNSNGFNYQEIIRTPTDFREMVNGRQQQDTNRYPVINQPVEKEEKVAQANFLPFGSHSIQDVPGLLINYHKNLSLKNLNLSNELNNLTIPRLEELKRDLTQKIKEIKTLQDDFRNDLRQEIALTGQRLYDYLDVLSHACYADGGNTSPTGTVNPTNTTAANSPSNPNNSAANTDAKRFKKDPFLLKFKLDYQLKNQILQESYLQEAYINLQTTASDLEKIIIQEIQKSLSSYASVVDSQIKISYELMIKDLSQDGFLSKPYYEEWNSFIDRDNNENFIKDIKVGSPIPKSRKLSDIEYPFKDNFISKCIKTGYMNKKSKYLKNYKKCFYLLTASSLFEFASDVSKKFEGTNTGSNNYTYGSVTGSDTSSVVTGYSNSSSIPPDTNNTPNNDASFQLKNATPTASYNLNYCTLGPFEYGKNKFVLHYNPKRKSGVTELDITDELESQKIAFKLNDQKELLLWYNYLKQLLKFKTPYDRAVYIEKRYLRSLANKKLKSNEVKDGITISADGTFNINNSASNNNNANNNNNIMDTVNNNNVLNSGASAQRYGSSKSTINGSGQLQGIAPEIIISDLSFVESQQSQLLQQAQQQALQQHHHHHGLPHPRMNRPVSVRSLSNSLLSFLIEDEASNNPSSLTRQYNSYTQKPNGSVVSFVDSPPRSHITDQNFHSSNSVYSNNSNNSSNVGGFKRPLMRLTNSTSNIHEGSLKNKLSDISMLKSGRRNKFMDSLFVNNNKKHSHSHSHSNSDSGSISHSRQPSSSGLSSPEPTAQKLLHKSNSMLNIRQNNSSNLNLLAMKKPPLHSRTMSGV